MVEGMMVGSYGIPKGLAGWSGRCKREQNRDRWGNLDGHGKEKLDLCAGSRPCNARFSWNPM
jgi:hypothetical protein